MNVQGHLVEERRRSVLMPYWHGIFPIGGVSGSFVRLVLRRGRGAAELAVTNGLGSLAGANGVSNNPLFTGSDSGFERPGKTIKGTSRSWVAKRLASGSTTYRERPRSLEAVLPPFSSFVPHSRNYGGQAGRVYDVDVPGVKTPGLSPVIPSG